MSATSDAEPTFASAEQAGLMKSNFWMAVGWAITGLALLVALLTLTFMMSFRHSFNDLKWYLMGSNALSMDTDELAIEGIGQFAEWAVAYLGNSNKASIDTIIERAAARFHPERRVHFTQWMTLEAEKIKDQDITVGTYEPYARRVEPVRRLGRPAWRVIVRAEQVFYAGALNPQTRTVDIELIVSPMVFEDRNIFGIEAMRFQNLFANERGEVMDALIEN